MSDFRSDDALEPMNTAHQRVVRSMSFEELLEGARAGKNAHIGELQRRFGPGLLRSMEHVAGERAQDVVNDTFMSLPKRLRTYVDDGRFERWIFALAYNLARVSNRAARRQDKATTEIHDDVGRDPSAIARVEEHEVLEQALRVLPGAEREAWLLHFEGYEPAEIGRLLGISPNAAAVRLHRAKQRLREVMGEG